MTQEPFLKFVVFTTCVCVTADANDDTFFIFKNVVDVIVKVTNTHNDF